MPQPDQEAARWNAHVASYERVFEPLTDAFNRRALDLLGTLQGVELLDLAAGAGGAALTASMRGARVTAVDAAPAMVARILARGGGRVAAQVADAAALPFPDGSFGAALSSFGVVLMPNPVQGLAEMRRVLRPGSRAAIVTWTEPHRYEVASRLRDAVIAVRGTPPPLGERPAQLRFTDPDLLRALMESAGFAAVTIERVEASLHAPSAAVLAGSLDFAPGMAAMLDALGPDRDAVLRHFQSTLEADAGTGPVSLGAVAHIAVASRPPSEPTFQHQQSKDQP